MTLYFETELSSARSSLVDFVICHSAYAQLSQMPVTGSTMKHVGPPTAARRVWPAPSSNPGLSSLVVSVSALLRRGKFSAKIAVALKPRLRRMVIQFLEAQSVRFAADGRGVSVALTNRSVFPNAERTELRHLFFHAVTDDSPEKASDPVRQ
jgi:hypothetical protein